MCHPSGASRQIPDGSGGSEPTTGPGLRGGLRADGLRAARPSRRHRAADGCDDSCPEGHITATETTDYPYLRIFVDRLPVIGPDGHVTMPPDGPRPVSEKIIGGRIGCG